MKHVPKPLARTADASRGTSSNRSKIQFALTVVLILAVLYVGLGLFAEVLARTIPDSWERKMAGISLPLLGDGDIERPTRILEHLMAGEELRDLEYRVRLVSLSEPNAMAVPGGVVGVTASLLQLVESEVGLAFVLAHELGHHEHRDNLRRLGRSLIFQLTLSLFTGHGTTTLLRSSLDVGDSHFSREQERAADAYAWELVRRKYTDLDGVLEFFLVMRAKQEEPRWGRYFASHPLTAERIESIREELKR